MVRLPADTPLRSAPADEPDTHVTLDAVAGRRNESGEAETSLWNELAGVVAAVLAESFERVTGTFVAVTALVAE
ncbi:hypothetical protein JCM17092_26510 [Haloplanus litoreus]